MLVLNEDIGLFIPLKVLKGTGRLNTSLLLNTVSVVIMLMCVVPKPYRVSGFYTEPD